MHVNVQCYWWFNVMSCVTINGQFTALALCVQQSWMLCLYTLAECGVKCLMTMSVHCKHWETNKSTLLVVTLFSRLRVVCRRFDNNVDLHSTWPPDHVHGKKRNRRRPSHQWFIHEGGKKLLVSVVTTVSKPWVMLCVTYPLSLIITTVRGKQRRSPNAVE